MRGRMLWGAFVAAALMSVPGTSVLAHGDGDARPLARDLTAGPYAISLWLVDSDAAAGMTSHLIVMFDGDMPTSGVAVTVNATPMEVHPSPTAADGWETTQGVVEGDQVTVTIADGAHAWNVGPVVVAGPSTPALPMKEIVLASILMTVPAAWWAVARTCKVWRAPAAGPAEPTTTTLSERSLAG